jgi:UDP-N-acetylglucosamine 2-epimerase (non-hydrolysing)
VIGVVYGTTGELIKLSAVLVRLRARDVAVFTICTGQQAEQIPALLADFDLPAPDLWLSHGCRGHDLNRPRDIAPWFLHVVVGFARHRSELRARLGAAKKPLLLVHGDTFTTVLGGLMGQILGVSVGHVEAGMRSGDWHNPFPEELNRVAAARLARVHFASGERAAANLRAEKVRGEIIDTRGNTIRDALQLVPPVARDWDLVQTRFGVASLHRFELLGRPDALEDILLLLREASRTTPIMFIDHPVTVRAIAASGLDSLFDERFRRVARQRYFRFIALLKASEFLVTDSGGSQQECAQLGLPCLVHRAVTEHEDGLDGPVVLSGMDLDVARAFLEEPPARVAPPENQRCPTDVIVEYLEAHGYALPGSAVMDHARDLTVAISGPGGHD